MINLYSNANRKMHIVVFLTAGSKEEAQKIIQALLQEKLVACGTIIDGAESHFWWQGKIDQAKETLLILKTRKALFPKVVKKVKSLHSYEVPEIIALPIVAGNKQYLEWIDESTR